MKSNKQQAVGIDDMSVYIPRIFLPIEQLAKARNIAYPKLNKGLGLISMSIPDVGEDTATMLANAVRDLIEKNDINPNEIGRIYLGTESALDGAKPTASYALELLINYFEPIYGPDCFLNCDVLDTTFACIGAVDTLQNTLDWIRVNPQRIGIVVAADNAKYELESTGEYTQGAGAIAMLVKAKPRLLAIQQEWGVSTKPVYDFYKPVRKVSKKELITEVLQLANQPQINVDHIVKNLENKITTTGILGNSDQLISIYKETPIFDGPYSNSCYQERIKEALANFNTYQKKENKAIDWDRLIFHLPYAYQARRMFGEIFWRETQQSDQKELLNEQLKMDLPLKETFDDNDAFQKAITFFWRAVTKTDIYQKFIALKIEKGERGSSQVGNMYAASIFLALMSTLEVDAAKNELKAGNKIGFFAYGSGSKSKVFVGELQEGWKDVAQQFSLKSQLKNRKEINYDLYEKRHRGMLKQQIAPSDQVFYLQSIDERGKRIYYCSKIKQLG